jgi:hypothetical protein
MEPENPEASTSDPSEILQHQVMLLQELNNRVASIQTTQAQLEQRVANLARANPTLSERAEVLVKNIDMPFFSMVGFMIKWTFASIPAAIIVALLIGLVVFLAALVLGGLGGLAAWLSYLRR